MRLTYEANLTIFLNSKMPLKTLTGFMLPNLIVYKNLLTISWLRSMPSIMPFFHSKPKNLTSRLIHGNLGCLLVYLFLPNVKIIYLISALKLPPRLIVLNSKNTVTSTTPLFAVQKNFTLKNNF